MKKRKVCRILLTVILWFITVLLLAIGLYDSAEGNVSWLFLLLSAAMSFVSLGVSLHMDTRMNRDKED